MCLHMLFKKKKKNLGNIFVLCAWCVVVVVVAWWWGGGVYVVWLEEATGEERWRVEELLTAFLENCNLSSSLTANVQGSKL